MGTKSQHMDIGGIDNSRNRFGGLAELVYRN